MKVVQAVILRMIFIKHWEIQKQSDATFTVIRKNGTGRIFMLMLIIPIVIW